MNNNIYKDMMNSVEPGEKFKNEVREKMISVSKSGTFSPRTEMRKPRLRPLLIASVIIIAVATTALAYGEEILQFIFAQQVENVDNEMQIFLYDSDETITMGISIINSHIDIEQFIGVLEFSTIDELRQAAAFDVKLPTYLPADILHLGQNTISGLAFNEDERIYAVSIGYNSFREVWVNEQIDEQDEQIYFELNQFFLGNEGQFVIETLSPFQRVMIGGSEGIVIHRTNDNPDLAFSSTLSMYWQKRGVLYIISSYGDGLDIDTMIKIAESL